MKLLYITFLLFLSLNSIFSVDYNPNLAKNYLYYAKTTFCEKKDIQNWTCDACKHLDTVQKQKVIENLVYGTFSVMGY